MSRDNRVKPSKARDLFGKAVVGKRLTDRRDSTVSVSLINSMLRPSEKSSPVVLIGEP